MVQLHNMSFQYQTVEQEEITDVILAALNLMRAHAEPSSAQYIGYFTPAELQVCTNCDLNTGLELIRPPVPSGQFSINIHHINQHWVTTCYNPVKDTITV